MRISQIVAYLYPGLRRCAYDSARRKVFSWIQKRDLLADRVLGRRGAYDVDFRSLELLRLSIGRDQSDTTE